MKVERQDWFEGQLVFLDETAATIAMACAMPEPRAASVALSVPQDQQTTTTVGVALRTSGLVTTTLFDGAINGDRFRTYVTDTLVPTLKPADTVILNNLAAHKAASVREAIQAAGASLLYLPPYSPDFNPFEQAIA